MKRLIEKFDRAYIINLHDRPDRRQEVEREFHKIGFSDIPNDQIHFYTAIRPTDKGNFHSLGARGVFTSHQDVLKLAIESKIRNVLVFEDDIAFRAIPDANIAQIMAQLSEKRWDLIFFGYTFPADEHLEGALIPWPNQTLGTHFYAVNGPFMSRMLDFMRESEVGRAGDAENGPTSADGIYNRVRLRHPDVRVVLAAPSLAFQRASRTDLQPNRIYDRVPFLAPGVRVARKLKHQLRMTLDSMALRKRPNN
jgi:hypothetical protein